MPATSTIILLAGLGNAGPGVITVIARIGEDVM
jgi:hypothetical protein